MNLLAAKTPPFLRRRDLLKLAGTGLGLSSLSLAGPLLGDGLGAGRATAKSCIYIFLCGGPSQHDLWDLKPLAPDGIRSTFAPIDTNVPGIQFGELLPQVSRHADKLAIVRSLTHGDSGHEGGIVRTLLGQLPSRPADFYVSRSDPPGAGAIVYNKLGKRGELPPWVILPRPFTTGSPPYKGQSGGFLGSAFDPLTLTKEQRGSLTDRPLELDATRLLDGLNAERLSSRQGLLENSNERREAAGRLHPAEVAESYAKAFDMLVSPAATAAFDLTREPLAVRDRYGRNEYGQSFLAARRLVEAGVRWINVFWTFFDDQGCQFNLWDNHGVQQEVCGVGGARTGIEMLKHDYCTPSFDRAFSALLDDLHASGLLEETLVAVAGEFGRTPRINATAGRDHWSHCYTQLLAGGGVRGGEIYGASDRTGAYVKSQPVSPDDFSATCLWALGIPPEAEVIDSLGRPHRASPGQPLKSLF